MEQENTTKAICKVTCGLRTLQNSPEVGQVPLHMVQCERTDLRVLNAVIKHSKTVPTASISLHSPPRTDRCSAFRPAFPNSPSVKASGVPRGQLNAPQQKAAAALPPSTVLPPQPGKLPVIVQNAASALAVPKATALWLAWRSRWHCHRFLPLPAPLWGFMVLNSSFPGPSLASSWGLFSSELALGQGKLLAQ